MLLMMMSQPLAAQTPVASFSMWIEQDGQTMPLNHGAVTLRKAPFEVVMALSRPMAVHLSASLLPKTLQMAAKGWALSKLPGFENRGMAEVMFNPDNQLLICDDSSSYWFFTNKQTHRFNRVTRSGKQFICRRTVTQLVDIDEQVTLPVSDINCPIYLVAVHTRPDDVTEVHRQWLTIEWK